MVHTEWNKQEEDGVVYYSGPEKFGEASVIAVDEDGRFYIPGASEEFQGDFETLQEAVEAVEKGWSN